MLTNTSESPTQNVHLTANEVEESNEDHRDHFLQTHTTSVEENKTSHTSPTVVLSPFFTPQGLTRDHHEPTGVEAAVEPLQKLLTTSFSSSNSENSDDANFFTSSSLFPGFQLSLQAPSFLNRKTLLPSPNLSWSERPAAEEKDGSSTERSSDDVCSREESNRPMQSESYTDAECQTKVPFTGAPVMVTASPEFRSRSVKPSGMAPLEDRTVVPELVLTEESTNGEDLLCVEEDHSASDALESVPPSTKKKEYSLQQGREGKVVHVTEERTSPRNGSPARRMRKKVLTREKDTSDGVMKREGKRKIPLSSEDLHSSIYSTYPLSHNEDSDTILPISNSPSGVLPAFTPDAKLAHHIRDPAEQHHKLLHLRKGGGAGVAGRTSDVFESGTHSTVVVHDNVVFHRGPAPFRYLVFFIWLKAIGSYDSGAFSAALGAEDGIADEWNLDSIAQGTLTSSVFLGNVIGCPLAGHLLSLYDEKKTFGYALVFHLIFSVFFGSFPNYYIALLNRFFIGVTLAFIVVYTPVWVDEFSPKSKQSMWQALQNVGVPVGVMLGFLLGSYFPTYTTLGWSFSFFLKGLLMVPTLMYLYRMDSLMFNSREEPTVVVEDIFSPLSEEWSDTDGPYKEKSREEARVLRSTIQLLGESSNRTSGAGALADGEGTGVFVASAERVGWRSTSAGSAEGSPLGDCKRNDSRGAEGGHKQERDRGRKRGTRKSEGIVVSTTMEKRNGKSPSDKGEEEEEDVMSRREETPEEKGHFLAFRDPPKLSTMDETGLVKSITSPFWRSRDRFSQSHDMSSSLKSLSSTVLEANTETKTLAMRGAEGEAKARRSHPPPHPLASRGSSSPPMVRIPPSRSLSSPKRFEAGEATVHGVKEESPVAPPLAEDALETDKHTAKMESSTTYLDTAPIITAVGHDSENNKCTSNGRCAVYLKKFVSCLPSQLRTPAKAFFVSLHQLCTNVVYSCSTLSMCSLYFTATGLQNFVTQYLRSEPFNASMKTIMIGFGGSVVTAPVLGVICSGLLLDKLGGYSRHWIRTTLFSLFFGVLGCIGAVICCFLTTTFSFLVLMSILLFCGGAVVPPGVGLTMASLPPSRRSAGAALSQTLYNLLGNFSGPLVCGAVAKWTGELRWGIITVLLFSILGVVPLFVIVVWGLANKKKKIR